MQLQPAPRRVVLTRMGVETLEKWDAGGEIGVEIGVVAVVLVDALVKPAESVVLSGRESSVSRLGR